MGPRKTRRLSLKSGPADLWVLNVLSVPKDFMILTTFSLFFGRSDWKCPSNMRSLWDIDGARRELMLSLVSQ